MENRTAQIARACARDLVPLYGKSLPVEVETALQPRRPGQYVDVVAVASLVVSVASLAWTIYTDMAARNTPPSRDDLSLAVRERLLAAERDGVADENVVAITDAAAEHAIKAGQEEQ